MLQVKATANWTEYLLADGRNWHAYTCLQIQSAGEIVREPCFYRTMRGIQWLSISVASCREMFRQGVDIGQSGNPPCRTGSFEYPQ